MADQRHCWNGKQLVFLCVLSVCSLLWVFSWSYWNSSGPVILSHPSYQVVKRPGYSCQTTSSDLVKSEITVETLDIKERMWLTIPTKDVFLDTDENYLLPQLQEMGGFHVQKGLGKRRQKARTEFERCLLNTPPLQDFYLAPNESKSKVSVVFPKPRYHQGDRIQIRADLYDGYGNPRLSGGDDIRMRVVSKSGRTFIGADVVDLGNGSYLGTTLLPRIGTAFVQVYVTYPREFLREAVRLRLSLLATKWTAGDYEHGSINESTACLPSLPIPGYGSVCDLTELNGGLPYFCGRPTDQRLNCSHRKQLRTLYCLPSLPMSDPHQELMRKIDKNSPFRLIPSNISITSVPATDSSQSPQPLPPCWTMTPRSTWQTRAPRGWMDDHIWRPLTCSLPDSVDDDHVQQCLRDTSVFLVGDSNMRHWWSELRGHLNCSRVELQGEDPGNEDHQHKLCEVESHNTTLRWAFHGRPTFTFTGSDNAPLPLVIKESQHHRRHLHRRVILLLHYYLHFSPFSLGDYLDRVRAAKRHVQAFLQEVPDAKVLIRGPHAILYYVHEQYVCNSDFFGPAYIQLWHQEFRDLRDKVWFLDFWDMTVATQNRHSHPLPFEDREMVKVLLGYMCDNL